MWNKIYLVGLALASVAMCVLTYFPYGWLQSKTDPRDVQTNYLFYADISWTFLLISSLILLVAANIVLWKTRRSWAIWTTLLYFAIFIIAHKFWLERTFFDYQKSNNLTESIFTFGALSGVVLIILAAIIVFFNQYLVKRMLDKASPSLQPVESPPEETLIDEKNA